jgi:uncharacterized damage-inducible protein DinB
MSPALASFIQESLYHLDRNTSKLEKVFEELNESDIWLRPNEASNSVGNLVLHLCGNITQYIVSSLGGAPDSRTRDAEFTATEGFDKEALWQRLTETIENAKQVIADVTEERLVETKIVQGKSYTGIGNIMHVVEHYSYHTGQLIFWTKLLKNKDMGFYAGWALNQTNA